MSGCAFGYELTVGLVSSEKVITKKTGLSEKDSPVAAITLEYLFRLCAWISEYLLYSEHTHADKSKNNTNPLYSLDTFPEENNGCQDC